MPKQNTTWIDERERLIADTLAFVERLAADQTLLAAKFKAAVISEVAVSVALELAPSLVPQAATRSSPLSPVHAPLPPAPLPPIKSTSLRSELQARVEAFRALQQALQAERDAHYAQTMLRARSGTQSWH